MPGILTLLLISFASHILLYAACWSIDKTDIEKHNRKIKLNKYTNVLFFLWSRNEKVYWLVYILIISESIVFILLWILYITNIEHIFKMLFKLYIYIYLLGGLILLIKVLKKRVKDFISGKIR
ncbi:hypothetical protein [Lachnoanaerobaculum sp. Marseille-Q4761]|uniref:hypothetical protein n=1 Tax=Lachnoanaerobaculum sp. Marseille-Q4761 TaxID=2819511 RepID=UPI003FA58FE9